MNLINESNNVLIWQYGCGVILSFYILSMIIYYFYQREYRANKENCCQTDNKKRSSKRINASIYNGKIKKKPS